MAINPVSFPTPQAYSGGIDFSPLANLGNVYRQGQQQAAQQQTLAQLGNDPDVNNQLMIKSGVPDLVTQGLKGQQQQREYALQKAQDKRAAAAEARAQGNYDEAERNEKDAQAIFARIARQPAQQPIQQPPSPFPSPTTAPQGLPVMAQGAASIGGPAGGAVPAQAPQAAPDGISRDDLAAMARNPLTRALALDYLKKQVEDQKPTLLKEGERMVVRPPGSPTYQDVTPGGGQTKEQVVNDAREKWALEHKYTPEQASYYGATGKFPKDEELTSDQRTKINKLTDEADVADRVLSNIAQARVLSKSAYGFQGAGPVSAAVATAGSLLGLPKELTQGAVDTQDLINAAHNNVVQVARSYFPQRVTNIDLNLTKDLEGTANQPDAVRQKVYDRGETVFGQIAREKREEADAIRNKTFYKPGGGQPTTSAPAAPTTPAAPSGAKPTLQEFMVKARAANPGAKDSELAQYWKQKYGG